MQESRRQNERCGTQKPRENCRSGLQHRERDESRSANSCFPPIGTAQPKSKMGWNEIHSNDPEPENIRQDKSKLAAVLAACPVQTSQFYMT